MAESRASFRLRGLGSRTFEDDNGDAELGGVGEGEGDAVDTEAGRELGGATVEAERGLAGGGAKDFDVAPSDAAGDAGAEGLGGGLLGGEAGGEALGGGLLARAVGDLAGGIDAAEEALAEAVDAALDAWNFGEIGAETEDHGVHLRHHHRALRVMQAGDD